MSEVISVPYPAISRSTDFGEDTIYSVPQFELPGFGQKTSDKCNEPNFIEYCPDCHHTNVHSYHCTRWSCPVCYLYTARKRAREAASRLWGVGEAYRAVGEDLGFLNHIVISVPPSEYANFDKKKASAKARKHLKSIGVAGGSLAFHPYRLRDDVEDLIREDRANSDVKESNWDYVRGNYLKGTVIDGRELRTPFDYIEFAPHFHCVGFFKLKERSDSFFERTGWVYHNVSYEKYHEPLDKDGAARTLAYLCTHLNYEKGKQSITYFGVAAPNKVAHKIEIEKKVKKCPVCAVDYDQMTLEGNVSETIHKGDLYKIYVNSRLEADQTINAINNGLYVPELFDSAKCWIHVIHHTYSVRTDFSRSSKSACCTDVLEDNSCFADDSACLDHRNTHTTSEHRKYIESQCGLPLLTLHLEMLKQSRLEKNDENVGGI